MEKNWSKIRLAFDNYEGYIDNKQYEEISEEYYKYETILKVIQSVGLAYKHCLKVKKEHNLLEKLL